MDEPGKDRKAMASSYSRTRRQKAPKPLSVPVWSAIIGALFVVLGYIVASAFMAGFGMILLCWGIVSFSILYIKRRRSRPSIS
jgi:hypothetical protein